jgi:hypothetical protein
MTLYSPYMCINMLLAVFILWTLLGSFWYALICRIHNTTSWQQWRQTMIDRSRCDINNTPLAWYQLIPLVSRWYHMIQSKTKPLSRRYPISEFMMWTVFVITYLSISNIYQPYDQLEQIRPILLIAWAINRGLSLLIIYDIKTYQLHIPIWIITISIALGVQFLWITGDYTTAFVSSITIAWLFWLFSVWGQYWILRRYNIMTEWLGQWDILIGFLIGSLRAYISTLQDISSWLMSISVYISLSAILGIIHYMIRLWIQQSKQHNIWTGPTESLPFIPALIIGWWMMIYIWPLIQHR